MRKLVLALFLINVVAAASTVCKATDRETSGAWESISLRAASRDLRTAAYFVTKYGSDEVELRLVDTSTGAGRKVGDSLDGEFSPDGKWFATKSKDRIVLLNIATGREVTYPCAGEAQFSPTSKYLTLSSSGSGEVGSCSGAIRIVELPNLIVQTVADVVEYAFSSDGRHVAYVSHRGVERNVGIIDIEAGAKPKALKLSKSKLGSLTWSEDGSALAFLEAFEVGEGAQSFVVHMYDGSTLSSFDHRLVKSFPPGALIDKNGLRLTKNGSAVLFELKLARTIPATPGPTPLVQIWHSKDVRVPGDVKARGPRRTAAWNFQSNRFTDLSIEGREFATVSGDGTRAITYLDSRPKFAIQYGYGVDSAVTLESTDLRTGETRLIRAGYPKSNVENLVPSPNGQFLAYFYDKNWRVHELGTGRDVNISTEMNVVDLHDVEEDGISSVLPYGSPGWTDDNRLVIYDRYDIWLVPTNGQRPIKITGGRGERKVHRFHFEGDNPLVTGARTTGKRIYRTLALDDVYVLSLFGEHSKKSGFATYSRAAGVVDVAYDDVYIRAIFAAPNRRFFVYAEERFDTPPRFVAYSLDSGKKEIFARSNPFFRKSEWGEARTIEYRDARGIDMQGLLFSPAGYQDGVKYPMVVHIYERQADGLHMFRYPMEWGDFSVPSFTNNGYFVLLPDIKYGSESPGFDAVSSVTAAVSEALKEGEIDAQAVGLTGGSWGGYQTLFIVTQTDMFAAAVAGAAPTDLVSSYLNNEPLSGTPNMWRFEQDQFRIRVPLHEDATEYLRNSPVLHAGAVQTPVLSWFGQKDPSISPIQPVEMYNALRRAGKEHVLLMYPEEGHHLASKQAILDLETRTKQWFDHYLKGAPAAEWMKRGDRAEVASSGN